MWFFFSFTLHHTETISWKVKTFHWSHSKAKCVQISQQSMHRKPIKSSLLYSKCCYCYSQLCLSLCDLGFKLKRGREEWQRSQQCHPFEYDVEQLRRKCTSVEDVGPLIKDKKAAPDGSICKVKIFTTAMSFLQLKLHVWILLPSHQTHMHRFNLSF